MCDGSSFSDNRGGITKPVALVRIVNSRKIAVSPGIRLEPSIPNITIRPATMPIRLMITWTITNVAKLIPSIMMRPLRWKLSKGYDAARKISTCFARGAGNAGMCVNEDTSTKVV